VDTFFSAPRYTASGRITTTMATVRSVPHPPNLVPDVYAFTPTDPTVPLTGAGNRNLDVRELLWTKDFDDPGERMQRLRDRARRELSAKMPGTSFGSSGPTERDLNLLDQHLERALDAVGGNRKTGYAEATYYSTASEQGRYNMPHYVMDDPQLSNLIKERYNIANDGKPSVPADVITASAEPEALAIRIAVERTLPFTAVSRVDDELFRQETWRGHTLTDVVSGTVDAVPVFVPPVPAKPHAKLSGVVDNARFDEVTDQPLYPDGHPAWFAGWDQFFDDPFPQEMR